MNNIFLKNNIKNVISVISVVAILLIVMPIAASIIYSIPASDDFAAALTVSKSSPFITSIKTANHMYMTWGGIWSFYFLEDFINPLVYFEATGFAIGIELFIIFVLFIITIALVIDAVLYVLTYEHDICIDMLFLALFLVIFINTEMYTDVYFWFVGNCYMWGLILNNIVIILTAYYLKKNKHNLFSIIVLSVLGFFSCLDYRGAILSGVVYLFFLLSNMCISNFRLERIIPLVFMVLGGVTAVIAPGNFKRQAGMTTDSSFCQALFDAAWDEAYSLKMAFEKPIIIIAVISFLVLGSFMNIKRERVLSMAIVTMIAAIVVGYLNYFPLALGYGSRALPARITFGFYYQLFMLLGFALMLIGNAISNRVQGRIRIVGTVIPIIMFCIITFSGHYRDTVWYTVYSNLPSTKEISGGWKRVFGEIQNDLNENVTITIPAYYLGTILMTPQFGEGEESYVNYTAAEYFGKKSLTVSIDWERLYHD